MIPSWPLSTFAHVTIFRFNFCCAVMNKLPLFGNVSQVPIVFGPVLLFEAVVLATGRLGVWLTVLVDGAECVTSGVLTVAVTLQTLQASQVEGVWAMITTRSMYFWNSSPLQIFSSDEGFQSLSASVSSTTPESLPSLESLELLDSDEEEEELDSSDLDPERWIPAADRKTNKIKVYLIWILFSLIYKCN